MKMNIVKLSENAITPKRATSGSAGYDLCALSDVEIIIKAGQRLMIKTGIAIELPENTAGMIYARSGLSTKFGIHLSNGVGVVDSDYRGEIMVGLHNSSQEDYVIKPYERIAQLVVTPILCPEINVIDTLSDSSRGTGGFGSTGK